MEASTIKFPVPLKRQSGRMVSLEEDYIDREIGLMNESYFREMLYLEKKRTERSGKPFLLMLLHVGKIAERASRVDILTRVVSSVSTATRQTDIKGWYEYNLYLGMMFTEFGDADINEAKGIILEKVKDNLNQCLTPRQANSIEISFQSIPEKRTNPHKTYNPLNLNPSTNGSCAQSSPRSLAQMVSGLISQRWLLLLADLLLISSVQLLSIWLRHGTLVDIFSAHLEVLIITLIFSTASLYTLDLYNIHRDFLSRDTVFRAAVAALLGGGISAMIFYLGTEGIYGRWLVPLQMGLFGGLIALWRVIYGALFQASSAKIAALVLGAGRSGQEVRRLLAAAFSPYEVKGFLDDDPGKQGKSVEGLPVLGKLDQLDEIAAKMGIKAAILAITHNRSQRLTRRVLQSRLQGLEIIEMPSVCERLMGRIPVQHIQDQWLLLSDGFYLLSKEYVQKFKRMLDFVVSGMLLVFSAPLMAVTALAIRLESPGPIFYQQERMGKDCKVFTVFKFRSMRVDAEAHGAKWAQKRDPRVTRIGRWIRIFHIDELPQIWNVFLGEMSLVGPRPERPEFVRELESKIPYYCVRHTVAPGITGWAQVKYPYGASLDDALRKLEYDVYYIKNMSILLDFKILLRTVGVVLLGEGAR